MATLAELLNRQKAATAKRAANDIQRTESAVPNDEAKMPPTQVNFAALLTKAKNESLAREEAERAAKAEETHNAQEESRALALAIEQMESDYAPNTHQTGTDLIPYESYEHTEEETGFSGDYDSTFEEPQPYFDDIMAGINFAPDASQEAAVIKLSRVQYGCLIGAAGTGKTTTTRLLLHTLINGSAKYGIAPLRFEKVNLRAYHSTTNETGEEGEAQGEVIPSIALCAYTGQATQVVRKNMPGNWKKNVFTIHSLLGFYPETYFDPIEKKDKMRFVPYYTKLNKMPWDVIFIDEASMVDINLWHMLLDASKPGCRFYVIGDLNQLPPPIGMGMLGFALAKWEVAELTFVHRSASDSENKIIDAAHRVLKGQEIEFDDPKTNPNWRVIGMELDHNTQNASLQVINIVRQLKGKPTADGKDVIYDPWRDRVMSTMNGFNENDSASLLGQAPLNDALSQIFADPNYPRIVISHKTGVKRFAVGYRVMATKNESPAELNRVTNGLTGRIIEIYPNDKWLGDRRLVGIESEVTANRRKMLDEATSKNQPSSMDAAEAASTALDDFNWDEVKAEDKSVAAERNGGPASHVVKVKFDNGATRDYSMNAQIEQLHIAYASTTHKAQGAEMPTAIVVVHHSQRAMLCRENFYTAITRASQRVIVLYSRFGMNIALGKQKITGKTIREKVKSYEAMLGEGERADSLGFKLVNVRLSEFDK